MTRRYVHCLTHGASKWRVPVRKYALPEDFLFGAATSAFQIEGGTDSDSGRGTSIWDTFLAKHKHPDTGVVACDHYNRMPEDVELMKRLGLQAYRFSAAWPRVMPEGTGKVNDKGLDFYSRLVDKLLEAGIQPWLTLYHWDLPQALEDRGGWVNRDIASWFGDYAEVVARKLSDRVKHWGTLNEPKEVLEGYTWSGIAPGRGDPTLRMKVAHNLLRTHGTATQVLRGSAPDLHVGTTLSLVPIEPATPAAAKAAERMWRHERAFFLDALLKGEYPKSVLDEMERTGATIDAGDMKLISQPLDYLGVNWYLRLVVNRRGRYVTMPAAQHTQVGWEIYPESLTRMLVRLNEEYDLPRIYITENGTALNDKVENGRIHDLGRTSYIHNHLNALENAAAQGVNLGGYFAWSLLDNLEWAGGFKYTFGITHVDFKTLKRTVKDSGRWYRDVIAANRSSSG